MNETIIAWATHTLNVVHGCSKPAAVPPAALEMYQKFYSYKQEALAQTNHYADGTIPLKERTERAHQQAVILNARFGTIDHTDFTFGIWKKWLKPNTSPECVRCYAEELSVKRGNYALSQGKEPGAWTTKPWTAGNAEENVRLHPERIKDLKKLTLKPTDLPPSQRNRIFICSMGDIFHKLVPDDFLKELFYWLRSYPHIIMLLTKRPERAAEFEGPWPDNIWLGTTCGHPTTKWRIEYLRRSKAKTRFVSMEPLLASMTDEDANAHLGKLNLSGIDQVIVGGESGSGHRKMEMQWARDIRDVCAEQKTAFFFKQDSDHVTERRCYLVEKDGRRMQYRQFPGELAEPIQVGADQSPVILG